MTTEKDLREYLAVLRRRWLVIVAIVLACIGAAAAIAWTRPVTYSAQTQLFVSTTAKPSDSSQTYEGGLFAQQRVLSYVSIVSSPPVVQAVINQLRLQGTVQQVASRIHASVPTGTVLIDITTDDHSAAGAQALASAVAAQFTRFVEALEQPRSRQPSLVKLSVTSPARLPTSASSPRKPLYLALGALIGLVLGIGFGVLRDAFDTRVRRTEDVAALAGAPVIGSVLRYRRARQRPLVVAGEPRSLDAESYRQIRTNLHVILRDRRANSLVVSSAVSSDGKTLVAANLGLAFAQAGHSVVMVNADLRRPRLGEVLASASSRPGLTSVLSGSVALEYALIKHPDVPLSLLDTGPPPAAPSELLDSDQFVDLIITLTRQAELVIVDAPALLAVSDAAIVARATSGVILVAQLGHTRAGELHAAAQALRMVGAPVLGVVLNRVSRSEARRYDMPGDASGPIAEKNRTVPELAAPVPADGAGAQ